MMVAPEVGDNTGCGSIANSSFDVPCRLLGQATTRNCLCLGLAETSILPPEPAFPPIIVWPDFDADHGS